MKQKLMTVLGEFIVEMSYNPIGEDDTLRKLTRCINDAALPHIQAGKTPEETFNELNEAELEEQLFRCLTVGGGSGQRLRLYLKSHIISLTNF